ncbi:hypothetical protein [Mycolicibacterium fortuitum]|uniref:hypothetical protein n=1 Tax=Mycolicibacterium fortuitum TaxID=1766 RepID=UPI00263A01B2|nr:hypothetical protein [Mycolicibacterium fortuitum]
MRWPKSAGRDRRCSPRFSIEWPFDDRDVMNALTDAPHGFVDDAALPAPLAARRRYLNQVGVPARPRSITGLLIASLVLLSVLFVDAVVAGLVNPSRYWLIAILLNGAVVAAALWTGRPWYRRADTQLLRDSVVEWPTTRSDLRRYANADVLEAEWDARFRNADPTHRGAAALVWGEPHLVALAQLIANTIRFSPVWKSSLLDEHNVRLDLDAILREVTACAHRLWRHHAATHLHTGPPDAHAWQQVVAMIDTLSDYQRHVTGDIGNLVEGRESIRALYSDIPPEIAGALLGLASTPRSFGAMDAIFRKHLLTELDLLGVIVANSGLPVVSLNND